MGNIIRSLVSGFGNAIGDLFGAPLDFLSGKSCGSACGSTWDLICYIEHFCVANLLKLVAVLFLFYVVLLFIYFLHKIGICGCLGRGMCKMAWASVSGCFSACEYAFMFTWIKLKGLRRRREARLDVLEEDIEGYVSSSTTTSDEAVLAGERVAYTHLRPGTPSMRSLSSVMTSRERRRRRVHMIERSLRARSHRIRVGMRRGSALYVSERLRPRRHGKHVKTVQDIRVTRTSRFVRKSSSNNGLGLRRWT